MTISQFSGARTHTWSRSNARKTPGEYRERLFPRLDRSCGLKVVRWRPRRPGRRRGDVELPKQTPGELTLSAQRVDSPDTGKGL